MRTRQRQQSPMLARCSPGETLGLGEQKSIFLRPARALAQCFRMEICTAIPSPVLNDLVQRVFYNPFHASGLQLGDQIAHSGFLNHNLDGQPIFLVQIGHRW